MKKLLLIIPLLFASGFTNANDENEKNYTIPIANVSTHKTKISSEELYNIFTLVYPYWEDGTKIRIVLLKETFGITREFLWEFLGLTPSRYREIINTATSFGKVDRPRVVLTELEMYNSISTINGSIGYLGSGYFVISKEGDGVQILKVIPN